MKKYIEVDTEYNIKGIIYDDTYSKLSADVKKNYLYVTDDEHDLICLYGSDVKYDKSKGKWSRKIMTDQEIYDAELNACMLSRSKAYKDESDPLFLEYKFKDAINDLDSSKKKYQEWIEKIKEIKSRYPKPAELTT